jgi:hypothetical protein
VKRGGRQRVLVGTAVDVGTHQLFRRGVGHRSHRHIGGRQTADIGKLSRDSEVGQQDPSFTVFWLGEQDIGRFDVAVQQSPLEGVVECLSDSGDDGAHVLYRHPGRVTVFH